MVDRGPLAWAVREDYTRRVSKAARVIVVSVVLVALAGAGLALSSMLAGTAPKDAALCQALARAHVAKVVTAGVDEVRCERLELAALEPSSTALKQLAATSQGATTVLSARGADGFVIGSSVARAKAGSPWADFAEVPGFEPLYADPERVVYRPDPTASLAPELGDAMAFVARALIGGAYEPRITSFPSELRRVKPAEVMVLLRWTSGRDQLWRSARGTSLAKALLTASRVARERWQERESAMGGPLATSLPKLDVEVSWLRENGTLGSSDKAFVDRIVRTGQGVGVDYRGNWHYVLPSSIAEAKGSAHAALLALLAERGLDASVLTAPDARLYRFAALVLGTSPAPIRAAGSDERAEASSSAAGKRTVNVVP